MKFLHVEDSTNDAELIKEAVCEAWPECDIERVTTCEALKSALEHGGIDLILSDYTMPSLDGLSALEYVHEAIPGIPFIFLSGTIGEERAVEALKRGATDYVIKDRPARLIAAMKQALAARDEETRRKAAEELARQRTRELAEAKERLALLDKTKSDFLKLISHELRTPLNGM